MAKEEEEDNELLELLEGKKNKNDNKQNMNREVNIYNLNLNKNIYKKINDYYSNKNMNNNSNNNNNNRNTQIIKKIEKNRILIFNKKYTNLNVKHKY